jgi:hypothetical protein
VTKTRATHQPNPTDSGETVRPEPSGGPILHVRQPDADFRRAKAIFPADPRRPEAPNPKPDPVTRQTREENLVLPVHFSGDFSGGISGFSGGFSMKILGVISYSL